MLKAIEITVTNDFDTDVNAVIVSRGIGSSDVRGFSTAVDAQGITKVHILYDEQVTE